MFGGHGFGFGGGFMWLFWILVIIVIAWALKAVFSNAKGGAKDKSPMEILQERFARGEIDEEEFERRRKVLNR